MSYDVSERRKKKKTDSLKCLLNEFAPNQKLIWRNTNMHKHHSTVTARDLNLPKFCFALPAAESSHSLSPRMIIDMVRCPVALVVHDVDGVP